MPARNSLKPGTIKYINTDMELQSAENLLPLAAALNAAGLFTLHIEQNKYGIWSAAFEAVKYLFPRFTPPFLVLHYNL